MPTVPSIPSQISVSVASNLARRARRNHDGLPGETSTCATIGRLSVMVMMFRGWQSAVAPELLIAGDLIRVEQGARFEMRR